MYLGKTVTQAGDLLHEIKRRIALGWAALSKVAYIMNGRKASMTIKRKVHIIYLDKAYDRVPRQKVWRCLREQGVPEKYVCLVKDTYEDARIQVKTSI